MWRILKMNAQTNSCVSTDLRMFSRLLQNNHWLQLAYVSVVTCQGCSQKHKSRGFDVGVFIDFGRCYAFLGFYKRNGFVSGIWTQKIL